MDLEKTMIDIIKHISTNTEHKYYVMPVGAVKADLRTIISRLYYLDYHMDFTMNYLTEAEYEPIDDRSDEADMVADKMVEKYFNMEGWTEEGWLPNYKGADNE